MAGELAKLGAQEIIVACTHCHQTFQEFLPEFRTRTIYEVLNEVGLPDGAASAPAATFNIQDACGARQAPQVHEAVRRLVADLGHRIEEMPTTGSAASAAAPAAWCPRWPRNWPSK